MYLWLARFLINFGGEISILMGERSVQEVVMIFFHGELDVWMVAV